MTCPSCGVWGILEVENKLSMPLTDGSVGMKRFLPLLPITAGSALPEPVVGDTPLVNAPRLAADLGLTSLRLKDEGRNPSGSLKDRASWVGAVAAMGRTTACASTGNAASSLAAMCASLDTRAVIFVPERAPEAKIAQLQVFGATVFRVKGVYDDAYEISQLAVEHFGWYPRSAAVNPLLVEGKKVCGLELGEAEAADWIALSVGDGCTIAGVWKGLKEMYALGVLSRLPKLLGVQSERAPALYNEWLAGGDTGPARAPNKAEAATVADSISVGVPRNWRRAVRAVNESGGEMIVVSDAEIDKAMLALARRGGVYGEPAAATSIAGLAKRSPKGSAIAIVSGSGLKDVLGAQRAGGPPIDIEPDLQQVIDSIRLVPAQPVNLR